MSPRSDEARSVSEMSSSGNISADGFKWKSGDDHSVFDEIDASVAFKHRKKLGHIPADIAKREHRNVIIMRIFVAVVLITTLVGAALGTFRFVKKEEDDDFDDEYAVYSSEVLLVVEQNIQKLFLALDSFAVGIALEAAATNSSWPFVTANDWSLRTLNLKNLVGDQNAESFFAPLVRTTEIAAWELYSAEKAQIWYQQSVNREESSISAQELSEKTIYQIYPFNENSTFNYNQSEIALPVWQYYPISSKLPPLHPDNSDHEIYTNMDLTTNPNVHDLFQLTNATYKPSIGNFQISQNVAKSLILQPILNPSDKNEILGVVGFSTDWGHFVKGILPEGVGELILVLRMRCMTSDGNGGTEAGVVTYKLNGPNAEFVGAYDGHDDEYDYIEARSSLFDFDFVDFSAMAQSLCIPQITLHFYPTQVYENRFHRGKSEMYTAVVVSVFVFTALVFLIYDFLVILRQKKVMRRVMTQEKIVADMFPSAVRDRLYDQEGNHRPSPIQKDARTPSQTLDDELNVFGAAPLADLFPNTTVVFADIVGFTAWSSVREPQQVFRLLESLYAAFDKIAYRHGVFKVETVGDCYVAVAGLPEPNPRHAICVARFARDIVWKMKDIIQRLEVSLGPETSDLALRVGIHSGQVTAGVLRGERSRFQLFGDTMNTAARMEHTGEANCIHLSQATADLLKADGYSRLIEPRQTTIFAKGKGEMQTYWLSIRKAKSQKEKKQEDLSAVFEVEEQSTTSTTSDTPSVGVSAIVEYIPRGMTKIERLVEWHVEVLASLLQQIIAARFDMTESPEALQDAEASISTGKDVLDEVVTIINLKRFDADHLRRRPSPASIDIGAEAKNELRNYVAGIAAMYKDNPFHNFEHASHVTASVTKLLRRIVNVDGGKVFGNAQGSQDDQVNLVDLAGHSYGITSDPLTQFAVVFSAIIHDADHPGVPNAQLLIENTKTAQRYKKSIAEQNSVDLAWNMLMRDEFKNLRTCIYENEEGLKRFRQLVVNSVMATDIVDKELQELRKGRWDTAFANTSTPKDDIQDDRKATIVIEHLIQASDVAHTMQHWHVYKTWNEKFFMECYGAYKLGRASMDPSVSWYRGEIGFFDYYVIPLAMKLQECGVFGVASHEYLSYAMANRDEWVLKGEEIVKSFLKKYEKVYGNKMGFDGDEGDDGASWA